MKNILFFLVVLLFQYTYSQPNQYYIDKGDVEIWLKDSHSLVEISYLDSSKSSFTIKYYNPVDRKLTMINNYSQGKSNIVAITETDDKGLMVEIGKILFNEYLKYKYRTYGYPDDRIDLPDLVKKESYDNLKNLINKDIQEKHFIYFNDFEIQCIIEYAENLY